MTKKFVQSLGSYSIDAFVMFKIITNKNFSSSTCLNFEKLCLNGPSVTVKLPLCNFIMPRQAPAKLNG